MGGKVRAAYQNAAEVWPVLIYEARCRVCGWASPMAHDKPSAAMAEAEDHRCSFPSE